MDNRNREAVRGMVPGATQTNALSRFIGGLTQSQNSQPTARSQARAASDAAAVRRARVARGLQAEAARNGRAPLSENEIDAHLSTMGVR